MDKASAVLEILTTSSPQLLVGYQRLSSYPLPIDKEIDLDSSFVCPPLSEPGCAKPVPNQPLVGESVNLGSPPRVHSIAYEHHDFVHVLLVSSDSPESENDSPIPANLEGPSSVPVDQGKSYDSPT